MSDAGKINNSKPLGPIKDPKAKASAPESPSEIVELQRKDTALKQNQIYSQPAQTTRAQADQPSVAGHDLPELISSERKPLVKPDRGLEPKSAEKNDLKIDQQVLARNPVLAAQLQNRKASSEAANSKPKKTPPDPSHKSSGGKAKIPARYLRTKLPARLKGMSDDRIDNLDKLRAALDARMPGQDPRLIKVYAKTLLDSQSQQISKSVSIAELFALDEAIASLDTPTLILTLESLMNSYELEPLQEQALAEIIAMLKSGESEQLKALIRLFLPLPFPYTTEDPDDEFYVDERELMEDSREEDDDDEDDDEPESVLPSLTLPAKTEDSQVSISVRSLNYGKLHLFLDYNSQRETIKVRIKSDRNFDELGLAIELALEDADIDSYSSFHWRDSVLCLAETRGLQMTEKGRANPLVLRATNVLLDTIYLSDNDDGIVNADYKVL